MRVFISYSTSDGLSHAKKLRYILRSNGHDVFLAEHDIFASENIWDTIARECLERDLSIFLITPSSVSSKGQKREYDLAIANYRELMAFISKNLNHGKIFQIYPFIKPPKALDFDDSNFDSRCEDLSAQLVKLLDKKGKTISEKTDKFTSLPVLSTEELDSLVVKGCVTSLQESYQNETIVPNICNQITTHDNSDSFTNIGVHHRLPREWFLPYEKTKQTYYNEHAFSQYGMSIAFGEQEYLEKSILESDEIADIEVEFSPDGILEAVNKMRNTGYEPNLITIPIKYWTEMYRWGGKAYIEYDYTTPRTRLDSSLVSEGYNLKIVHPLGVFPKNTMLMSKNALKWHIKKYPEQSALYVVFGNHQLYPAKYVELLAGTVCKCEIIPKGISILKFKENS